MERPSPPPPRTAYPALTAPMPGFSPNPTWRALRFADPLLVALATAWGAWALGRAGAWTVDDAFIVARYADNLVRDGVLSFNLTGPRVEGFTSPLFTAVACAATALGGSAITAMKVLGIGAHLVLGLAILGLGRALRAPPPATGLVALFSMTMAEHVTHAKSGLETEAFVLACVLAMAAFIRLLQFSDRRAWITAMALTLVALTRPEGIAVAGVLLAVLVVRFRRADSAVQKRLARAFGVGFVLPIGLLTLARLSYYGSLLPNTFYAKFGGWNLRHAADLVEIVTAHFGDAALVGAALVTGAWVMLRRSPAIGPREQWATLAAALSLATCSVVYAHTDLVMNFGRRFAVHTLPLVIVLLLVWLKWAVHAARKLSFERPLIGWTLVAVCFAFVAAVVRDQQVDVKQQSYRAAYVRVISELHAPFADWVESNVAADEKVAFYPDAGYIPYRTRRFAIDFGKLNDSYLARRAATPEDVVRYFFEQSPAALVISRDAAGKLWDAGAEALVSHADFQARYRLVETRGDPRGATLSLYARRR